MLRPGGRMIGVNLNMYLKPEEYHHLKKYGATFTPEKEPLEEGGKVYIRVQDESMGLDFTFYFYYLKPETYERAF
jgi:DNA-binding transcriptional ArsR family regulator